MEISELVGYAFAIVLTIIGSLFTVIGFFLKVLHSDVKKNTEENGKNKGRIELVEAKANSEIARLTETTQLEIRQLTDNVRDLSNSIKNLVDKLIDKK